MLGPCREVHQETTSLQSGALMCDAHSCACAHAACCFDVAHAAMDSQQLEAELADLQSYMQSAQPKQLQYLKQTIMVRASCAKRIINIINLLCSLALV